MRRYGIIALLLLGSLLLQSTLIGVLPLKTKPDLVLILVIFFALFNGVWGGTVFGAVAGLSQDLLRGRLVGMNLLALAITGYLTGWLANKVFKENIIVPLVLVFVFTILHGLLMLLFTNFAGIDFSCFTALRIGLIEALYNTFLVPLFYGKFLISSTRGSLKPN